MATTKTSSSNRSGKAATTKSTRAQGTTGTHKTASAGKTGTYKTAGSAKSGSGRSTRATKTAGSNKSGSGRKWSADVTEHSNAMDLKKGVFTSDDPKKIASSVERSAEKSPRKKGNAEQSAMSMLNFYINRAGKNLPAGKKKVLNKAKDQLKAKSDKKA